MKNTLGSFLNLQKIIEIEKKKHFALKVLRPFCVSNVGFTLIEMMIAMTLMSFIALFTSSAITSMSQSKKKIQTQLDETSEIRTALNIMKRDISKAFNYRDIHIRLYNEAMNERIQRAEKKKENSGNGNQAGENLNPGQQNPPQGGTPQQPSQADSLREKFIPKKETLVTQFIGGKEDLHFSSLSNVRYKEDSKISTQSEVSYSLKRCKTKSQKSEETQCLMRRLTPTLDEDTTTGGTESVLLENVTKLSFKYLIFGTEEPEWTEDWDSRKKTRGGYPLFPDAIEITLEIKRPLLPKAKPITMTRYAPLFFSNPPDKNLKPFVKYEGVNSQNSSGDIPPPPPPPHFNN